MQIIVRSHSALAFWRHAAMIESRELQAREERWCRGDMRHDELSPNCACNLLLRRRGSVADGYAPHLRLEDARDFASTWNIELPIRVHAASPDQNRSTSAMTSMGGALPKGQLVFAERGVWVVSPEMCLADLAKEASTMELLKLAYEYQSAFHDASASRDAMKRMALERDGWHVICIGNGQVTHEAQMDVVAKEAAQCLGVRLSPRGAAYRGLQHNLFNDLVRFS